VRESALRHPRRLALVGSDRCWNYHELDLEVVHWARELAGRGVRKGDRVALVCGNQPEFVFLVHALARLGATCVPLNTRWTEAEIQPVLDDVDPRLVLSGSADALSQRGRVHPERSAAGTERGEGVLLDGEAVQAILFTSGTTGRPKGAELTVANFAASARASANNLGGDPDQRWLACLPLYHVGSLAMLIRCAWYGAALVVHERFDPDAAIASMEREGVTHLSLVEPGLAQLLEASRSRPFPSSLKAALVGGGPASPELLDRARSASLPVLHTYGLTEATSQVTAERMGGADGRTAGIPLRGVSVRIVDADGRGVAAGQPGEIEVRGPTVMRGYRADEVATSAAFRNGWLRTMDIGSLDEQGRLTVFARRSDLILSGGENIYPAEVERVLTLHPQIAVAAVIAQPDPKWGQVPVAAFVAHHGSPSRDELERHCRSRLAGFKVPKRFVQLESLPNQSTGKLDRVAIRSLVERELEQAAKREAQSA